MSARQLAYHHIDDTGGHTEGKEIGGQYIRDQCCSHQINNDRKRETDGVEGDLSADADLPSLHDNALADLPDPEPREVGVPHVRERFGHLVSRDTFNANSDREKNE